MVDFAQKHVTARQRLFALLSDLRWHSHKELRVAGVRYGARLLELKREGYQIESDGNEDGNRYRLLSLDTFGTQEKRVKAFFNPDDVRSFFGGKLTNGLVRSLRVALDSYTKHEGRL